MILFSGRLKRTRIVARFVVASCLTTCRRRIPRPQALKQSKSNFSRAKSFADDLNKERGTASSRVALLLRSAEIKISVDGAMRQSRAALELRRTEDVPMLSRRFAPFSSYACSLPSLVRRTRVAWKTEGKAHESEQQLERGRE